MKNVLENILEKIKTHILYSVIYIYILFFFTNRAVYEIIWKNMVEPARSQVTNGTCAFHAVYLRLQTHTHNM